ncbi:MAG: ExbD/TolR family protein [Rickettsiales bacterium]|nr:ExbD/TolR family protein [Rickettsiales bacterium]
MIFKTKYSNLYSGRKTRKVMSEINVTPFVDVMLVLLVIFMISAPLLVHGVNVNLPKNSKAPPIDSSDPFTLTVTEQGKIFYKKKQISFNKLKSFLKDNALSLNTKIYVKGDKKISYGEVMRVIAEVNKAGYSKVALVTTKT